MERNPTLQVHHSALVHYAFGNRARQSVRGSFPVRAPAPRRRTLRQQAPHALRAGPNSTVATNGNGTRLFRAKPPLPQTSPSKMGRQLTSHAWMPRTPSRGPRMPPVDPSANTTTSVKEPLPATALPATKGKGTARCPLTQAATRITGNPACPVATPLFPPPTSYPKYKRNGPTVNFHPPRYLWLWGTRPRGTQIEPRSAHAPNEQQTLPTF